MTDEQMQEPEMPGDAQAVESVLSDLEKCRAEAAEYLDQWRRSAAELSNARKRMQREQAELNISATARVMGQVLPIMDDINRALDALPSNQEARDWAKGFRLIQAKLQALLKSEGVSPIVTEGQLFDPTLHEAVSYEEQPGFSEGQIIGEVASGYKLGDRVLKPSMVRVAR